ncbi:rhodanese-like domain-containing protein [Pseudofrancisella aestuarii]|uniref:Rhodanese-like domain-containing protein n=1 Tax=Pseudofrancisella aestuarii TaxID=2670347 RepID=A0ABV9TCV8_9GAMM|nr:rhodanese-like domain-containing protein [Pseudofrancisella aestuarii]
MIETISATALNKRLQNEKIRIIDIRSEDEFKREHIEGAQNVPAEHVDDEFCYTNDDILVFSCMSGVRTQNCSAKFKKMHAKEVLILQGGLNAWKKEGLKTKKNEKAPLPIMRQVQIIVGSIIILGVILSYTVHHHFIILSAFFGAGLLFAGVTGTCALAKVLMYLPYNKNSK